VEMSPHASMGLFASHMTETNAMCYSRTVAVAAAVAQLPMPLSPLSTLDTGRGSAGPTVITTDANQSLLDAAAAPIASWVG